MLAVTVALAERSRGRKLTAGEKHLDLAAGERALETAKAELAAAIGADARRMARAVLRGERAALRVTPAMVRALEKVWRAGQANAKAELRSMGIAPAVPPPGGGPGAITVEYASVPDEFSLIDRIERLRPTLGTHLSTMLNNVSLRVEEDARSLSISGLAAGAVADRMATVPGALDMASRLVSSGYASGLGSIYETNRELFPAWQYSAVHDGHACSECSRHDGAIFDSLEAAYRYLPNFGPNPYCFGDGRCRCRLVPAPPDEGNIPAERRISAE